MAERSIYIVCCYGDIPRLVPSWADYRAFPTLDQALRALAGQWGDEPPDPEDDRIVIYEASTEGPLRVVWHFSGWHWNGEAGDLPGGPLPQGRLLDHPESLYEEAMRDY